MLEFCRSDIPIEQLSDLIHAVFVDDMVPRGKLQEDGFREVALRERGVEVNGGAFEPLGDGKDE